MNMNEVDAMTVQQAIEYALDNLVMQGARCMGAGDCSYGDKQGNHCAIGWLLDANNRELMRYKGAVNDIMVDFSSHVPLLIKDNLDTFLTFQGFHDAISLQEREHNRGYLESAGIDTSHPNFQKWIDLGREIIN
jgi:hypothetical protein